MLPVFFVRENGQGAQVTEDIWSNLSSRVSKANVPDRVSKGQESKLAQGKPRTNSPMRVV